MSDSRNGGVCAIAVMTFEEKIMCISGERFRVNKEREMKLGLLTMQASLGEC